MTKVYPNICAVENGYLVERHRDGQIIFAAPLKALRGEQFTRIDQPGAKVGTLVIRTLICGLSFSIDADDLFAILTQES